jgi:hypothetical protein
MIECFAILQWRMLLLVNAPLLCPSPLEERNIQLHQPDASKDTTPTTIIPIACALTSTNRRFHELSVKPKKDERSDLLHMIRVFETLSIVETVGSQLSAVCRGPHFFALFAGLSI